MKYVAHVVVCLMLGLLGLGCVQPKAAQPVAESNAKLVSALGDAYLGDLIAFRASVNRSLEAESIVVVGDIHRSLLVAGYVGSDGAKPEKFNDDLPLPEKKNALLNEVRLGRLSKEAAAQWLNDYATLMKASNGKPVRDRMILTLAEGQEFTDARDALLAAFEQHFNRVAETVKQSRAGADSIVAFTSARYELQDLASSQVEKLWTSNVSARLKDNPGAKARADELLALVLGKEASPK